MSMLGRCKTFMEQNKYLQRWVEPIESTRIIKYLREKEWLKASNRARPAFCKVYETHKAEFEKVAQMLEDDFSRKTLQTIIDYRLDPRGGVLQDIIVQPQYFMPDIFGPAENEVFVDGGAYTGDTILSLIQEFGKGKAYYKKIYAWEPDPNNRRRLMENCKEYNNIKVLPFGMWSEKTTLFFQTNGYINSHIANEGTVKVPVDSIDDLCSKDKITFIKMDIEGSEVEALRGAEKVIRRDKPRLAICIYHKPEHFYEIPFLIKEMVPEYKLYIRHHFGKHTETVLYAVCPPDAQ